jgi:MarR family transcriptional regulator, lower aerobic nicotinate degradation pathway regulator
MPHDERITWLLWTAQQSVRTALTKIMGYRRLHHYWLLAPLAEFGPHTHKELAKRLRVKQSQMSQYADELEGRGWITRTTSKDKRYKSIELTDAGRKCVSELNLIFATAQKEIKKKFSAGEWREGLRFLYYLGNGSTNEGPNSHFGKSV